MHGTTPRKRRYHTADHEKNPEASEYRVLNTFPIILVCVYEIEAYGIAYECEGKDALSDEASEKEHEVIDEKIEREHQHAQPSGDQYAVEAPFDVAEHQPEERPVERHERKQAEYRRYAGEVGLFVQKFYHLITVL